MFVLKALLPLVSLLSVAVASPIEARQSATTCGSTSYSAAQVRAAVNAACSHYQAGTAVGRNSYPHRYNNREGFNFAVGGSYQEFPIRSRGVYTGGSPGADRIVINTDCQYAGAITHNGARGNNFVGCSGTN